MKPKFSALNTELTEKLRDLSTPATDTELMQVDYPEQPRLKIKWQHAVAATIVAIVLLGALIVVNHRHTISTPPASTAHAVVTGSKTTGASKTTTPGTANAAATPSKIVVAVVGEVPKPGLYTVAPDARVADVLAGAGVSPETAGLQLNLAQKVTDGQQLVVGSAAAALPGAAAANPAAGGTSSTGQGAGGKVSLNNATKAQLEALPGIGDKTAQAIIDLRSSLGGFSEVAQLKQLKGIGEAKFAKLAELVTL